MLANLETVLEKNGWRFRRLKRVVRGKPTPDVYALRGDCLYEWEKLSQSGQIDIFYGDVCTLRGEVAQVGFLWFRALPVLGRRNRKK